MKKIILSCCYFLITSLSYAESSHDDPWFTGPLLANTGIVNSIGEGELEIYGADYRNYGLYDREQVFVSTPRYSHDAFIVEFSYGLAEDIDTQWNLQYVRNQNEGQSHSNFADTYGSLGFQILRQKESKWRPNLRITLSEIFPTGRYDRLNQQLYGTDATGGGSYQTLIGFNFELLSKFSENHYLNTYANLTFGYQDTVDIKDFSIYGGSNLTAGKLNPGNYFILDLAAEYSITRNWVAVMEGFFLTQQASTFKGLLTRQDIREHEKRVKNRIPFNRLIPTKRNIGNAQIGSGNVAQITWAPALEYNINANLGLIGGVWFSTDGKNTPAFVTSILALNITW